MRLDHTTFQARAHWAVQNVIAQRAVRCHVQQRLISSCALLQTSLGSAAHSAVQRTRQCSALPVRPCGLSFGLQVSAQCFASQPFGLFCGGTHTGALAAHGWDRLALPPPPSRAAAAFQTATALQQRKCTEPIECSAPDPPHPTPPHTGDCRTALPAAHCSSPNRNDPRGDIAAPGAERTCSVSRVSD